MKVLLPFHALLALFVAGCVAPLRSSTQGRSLSAAICQRTTNVFDLAQFYKPADTENPAPELALAPLILQQVGPSNSLQMPIPILGRLSISNAATTLDYQSSTVYCDLDTFEINGRPHTRYSYVWFSAAGLRSVQRPPVAESGPVLQGVRITIDSSGLPAIWEVMTDPSAARILFVSHSLEAAAAAQYGAALPGRRYAIESTTRTTPNVVVARAIEAGAMAMGPIVYLERDAVTVSTVLCRCMPAQAKGLVSTHVYRLLPWRSAGAPLLDLSQAAKLQQRSAFWPGEPAPSDWIEQCLRLPRSF